MGVLRLRVESQTSPSSPNWQRFPWEASRVPLFRSVMGAGGRGPGRDGFDARQPGRMRFHRVRGSWPAGCDGSRAATIATPRGSFGGSDLAVEIGTGARVWEDNRTCEETVGVAQRRRATGPPTRADGGTRTNTAEGPRNRADRFNWSDAIGSGMSTAPSRQPAREHWGPGSLTLAKYKRHSQDGKRMPARRKNEISPWSYNP